MKRIALVFALIFLSAGIAFSADFGLLFDQKFEAWNDEAKNTSYSYSPSFTPWFSWNGSQGLSLYFSGLVSMQYNNSDDGIDANDGWGEPVMVPELSRFSLSYRYGQLFAVDAGRIFYSDAMGMVASGLFDGIQLRIGGLSLGAFYTGLLYKDTAKIMMTGSDAADAGFWDWDNVDLYFASKRALFSLRYDKPLLEYHNFTFEALAQFDLNNAEDKLNSQYCLMQMEFLASRVSISLGGLFEAMQNKDGDFTAGVGALASIRMEVPGSLNDSFKLSGIFGSGEWNDIFTGFTPVSSAGQGNIFSSPLMGLWVAKASYDARLISSLFAEVSFSVFGRAYDDPAADSMLHGYEVWASLGWQPMDDIRVNFGGGAYIPSDDADTLWKISAGLSLSF